MNTKSLRSLFFFVILACAKGLTAYSPECCDDYSRAYIRAEGGVSFATTTTVGSKNASLWPDQSILGDSSLKHKLSRAGLVGVHVGYNFNRWLSMDVAAEFRGDYKYRNALTVAVPVPGLQAQNLNFNLDNNAYTLNFFFNRVNGGSCWAWDLCGWSLNPYVGVGFGWSRNTMYNLNVALPNAPVTLNALSTLTGSTFTTTALAISVPYYTNNTFAWNVQVGFDINFNRCFGLGLGYRYFDGGRFKSAAYSNNDAISIETAALAVVNTAVTPNVVGTTVAGDNPVNVTPFGVTTRNNPVAPLSIDPLRGKLRAHEFVAALTWNF